MYVLLYILAVDMLPFRQIPSQMHRGDVLDVMVRLEGLVCVASQSFP